MAEESAVAELRQQPHSLDAERATLGSILIDNRLVATVSQYLKAEHFYDAGHRAIFEAIRELEDAGSPIDPTTLAEALMRAGKFELAGGSAYLAVLESAVLSTSNVAAHCKIVLDKALKRQLIKALNGLSAQTLAEEELAADLLTRAQQSIFNIQRDYIGQAVRPITETVQEVLHYIEDRRRHAHLYTGQPSGYTDLDDITSGFQKSDMIILAGLTSRGKTALALNIAADVAVRQRKTVLYFSLEMSRHQLVQRLMAITSGIDLRKIRAPRELTDAEMDSLAAHGRGIALSPLLIDDTPGVDIADVRTRARHYKAHHPDLALVFVDYLQLITLSETGKGSRLDSRQQEVARISGALKGLARDLDTPLIALAQLSRQAELRRGKDKEPILSDLRESGAIEQDSDLVMFVHRPDFYVKSNENAAEQSDYHEASILVRKHRNGRTGNVELFFHSPTTRFVQKARPGETAPED
ncbi:MAG: replicative DNA helicase [Candidatus Sumerlaeota bacterium]|nr:replicative DNA helicase [Candidatus Sumerlaeota bacterium]